jgi:hypothetical protein
MALKTNQKVSRYRDRMRAAGLRPIQIWVPDTRRPDFARELMRQVALLYKQPEEQEALDFIEAVGLAEVWE